MASTSGRSWHQALDMLATLMVILVCAALLWSWSVSGGFVAKATSAKPARGGRPEPPLPTEPISLIGAQVRGSPAAKVAFVEFSDFECPFCGSFAREMMPVLEKAYVDRGQLLLAFIDFPLEQIHTNAFPAAVAAECAGREGKFWEMHDLLFSDQKHLTTSDLRQRARVLGLNTSGFDSCLAGDASKNVKLQEQLAESLSISGTPTFMVGSVLPNAQVKVLKRFSGVQDVAHLKSVLDTVMASIRETK